MRQYTTSQKSMHWLIAVMIIISLSVGFSFNWLPSSEFKNTLRNLHKLSGLIILGLVLVRVYFRLYTPAPPLQLGFYHKLIAKASHLFLYVMMFAMPVTGWVMSSAVKKMPYSLPTIPGITYNKSLAGVFYNYHSTLGIVFAVMIMIHILATLYHQLRVDLIFQRISFRIS